MLSVAYAIRWTPRSVISSANAHWNWSLYPQTQNRPLALQPDDFRTQLLLRAHGVAGVDELVDVFMQLVVSAFVDVHHVAALVVCEAGVLADHRLEPHVRNRFLDAVERRGEVVV